MVPHTCLSSFNIRPLLPNPRNSNSDGHSWKILFWEFKSSCSTYVAYTHKEKLRIASLNCNLIHKAWDSLVEGGEGLYLLNRQTNLVLPLHTVSIVLKFLNTAAYHLGRYEPSSPISCRAPRLRWWFIKWPYKNNFQQNKRKFESLLSIRDLTEPKAMKPKNIFFNVCFDDLSSNPA